ncbi:MAG: hypothetical protein LUC21_02025, partial [Oscillospiraceae bacterium]|nr:hypothetical protein [Oscillospiraceae bacterium]
YRISVFASYSAGGMALFRLYGYCNGLTAATERGTGFVAAATKPSHPRRCGIKNSNRRSQADEKQRRLT